MHLTHNTMIRSLSGPLFLPLSPYKLHKKSKHVSPEKLKRRKTSETVIIDRTKTIDSKGSLINNVSAISRNKTLGNERSSHKTVYPSGLRFDDYSSIALSLPNTPEPQNSTVHEMENRFNMYRHTSQSTANLLSRKCTQVNAHKSKSNSGTSDRVDSSTYGVPHRPKVRGIPDIRFISSRGRTLGNETMGGRNIPERKNSFKDKILNPFKNRSLTVDALDRKSPIAYENTNPTRLTASPTRKTYIEYNLDHRIRPNVIPKDELKGSKGFRKILITSSKSKELDESKKHSIIQESQNYEVPDDTNFISKQETVYNNIMNKSFKSNFPKNKNQSTSERLANKSEIIIKQNKNSQEHPMIIFSEKATDKTKSLIPQIHADKKSKEYINKDKKFDMELQPSQIYLNVPISRNAKTLLLDTHKSVKSRNNTPEFRKKCNTSVGSTLLISDHDYSAESSPTSTLFKNNNKKDYKRNVSQGKLKTVRRNTDTSSIIDQILLNSHDKQKSLSLNYINKRIAMLEKEMDGHSKKLDTIEANSLQNIATLEIVDSESVVFV